MTKGQFESETALTKNPQGDTNFNLGHPEGVGCSDRRILWLDQVSEA